MRHYTPLEWRLKYLWQSRKVTCHACVCLGYRWCLFLRFWNLILKLCDIFVFHFITKCEYALTSRPRRQVGEPHSQAHHHYEYHNYRYDNRGEGNSFKRDRNQTDKNSDLLCWYCGTYLLCHYCNGYGHKARVCREY